eukprot:scaffold116599_cov64-Phaeocystis_antarctica.AAC.2
MAFYKAREKLIGGICIRLVRWKNPHPVFVVSVLIRVPGIRPLDEFYTNLQFSVVRAHRRAGAPQRQRTRTASSAQSTYRAHKSQVGMTHIGVLLVVGLALRVVGAIPVVFAVLPVPSYISKDASCLSYSQTGCAEAAAASYALDCVIK